jgi:hypothetical protein
MSNCINDTLECSVEIELYNFRCGRQFCCIGLCIKGDLIIDMEERILQTTKLGSREAKNLAFQLSGRRIISCRAGAQT